MILPLAFFHYQTQALFCDVMPDLSTTEIALLSKPTTMVGGSLKLLAKCRMVMRVFHSFLSCSLSQTMPLQPFAILLDRSFVRSKFATPLMTVTCC